MGPQDINMCKLHFRMLVNHVYTDGGRRVPRWNFYSCQEFNFKPSSCDCNLLLKPSLGVHYTYWWNLVIHHLEVQLQAHFIIMIHVLSQITLQQLFTMSFHFPDVLHQDSHIAPLQKDGESWCTFSCMMQMYIMGSCFLQRRCKLDYRIRSRTSGLFEMSVSR